MIKYKTCPLCGRHNDPVLLECLECETDLSGIPVLDEEMQRRRQQEAVKEIDKPETDGGMIRQCDCGTVNPVQARKCSGCGEDLSDVVPMAEAAIGKRSYLLTSIDGEYAYEVTQNDIIIGREALMQEYLTAKPYVSRQHARLLFTEGRLYVKNLSQTNQTYVNQRLIAADEAVELHPGDEIGLGGTVINGSRQTQAAYFIVGDDSCI